MEDAFISRSSRIADDPLSDVLSLLKPRGYQSGGIDAGGDWSFQFPKSNGFFCLALVSGYCWLSVDGVDEPVLLQAAEFAVLPHGPAFRAASDPGVAPVDLLSVLAEKLNGKILTWQGGGACLGLSAIFTFSGEHANILSEVLSTLIHIRNPADRVALHWYLERMMAVIRNPQPGGVLQGEYLAQIADRSSSAPHDRQEEGRSRLALRTCQQATSGDLSHGVSDSMANVSCCGQAYELIGRGLVHRSFTRL
jgi:hypothetical protein